MFIVRCFRENTRFKALLFGVVLACACASIPTASFALLTNGENALDLVGQFDETSFTNPVPVYSKTGANNGPNIFGVNGPAGIAIDTTKHLMFETDTANNRVLVFLLNAANAMLSKLPIGFLGQTYPYTKAAATTQNGLNGPVDVTIDSANTRVFISDSGNNRVLVQNYAAADGQNAVDLLGQYNRTDFTTTVPIYTKGGANDGPNVFGLSSPRKMVLDGANHRLFLTDANNNRVLVYAMNADSTFSSKIPVNVLGQPDFLSNNAVTTQNGMNGPNGLAYDSTNSRLFVSQVNSQRVTVYSVPSIINGQNATNVLGQPNYTSSAGVTTQNGMSNPYGLEYDSINNRLFVAQANSSRVTTYSVASITDGQNAANVLGEPDFTSASFATSQNRVNGPQDVAYDSANSRLFVSNGQRVTVYSVASITNGQNATNVLGEPDFTTFATVATQNGMASPVGLAYDSVNMRLFVSDTSDHRITVYSVASITNGQNATNVLGQPNYTSSTGVATQNGMANPQGLFYDSTNSKLFVGEGTNNRVTTYSAASITDGQNAVDLLGQYDQTNPVNPVPLYTKGAANDGPNKLGFSSPSDVALDTTNHRLFVLDVTNNRVLVYALNGDSTFSSKIPVNVLGQPDLLSNTAATTQNGMNSPKNIAYDSVNARLFVSQLNRVIVYSVSSITNGQNAVDLLGEYDETNFINPVPVYTKIAINNGPNKFGLSALHNLALDTTNHRLFVSDSGNNRVLVYTMNADGTFSSRIPTNVLGQSNYYTNATNATQNGMNAPWGLAYDSVNSRLFVAQNAYNRVTVYSVASITDGQNATNVLGQPNYTTSTAATTQNGMNVPTDVAYDSVNSRLFVAQTTGTRVTVYSVSSITNGQNATNVLGQPNYTTTTAATTQNGMGLPQYLAYDSANTRLFVSMITANRVTVYSVASITDGQNATNVLGQPNYTTATAATTQNGMNAPYGLAYDSVNSRLFVSNNNANRVTVYSVASITDGQNATNVLGQPNYTTATAATTQNGFNTCRGLAFDAANNRLYVGDAANNRLTVYSTSVITNGQNAVDLLGEYDQTNFINPVPVYAKGNANDGPNRFGFNAVSNLVVDTTSHRLFVADGANNRVLVYAMNGDGTFSSRIPTNILGQSNYYTNPATVTQNGIKAVTGLAYDSTNSRLFVSQNTNSRVTVYSVATIADGQNATNVLGQPNYTTATAATTQNGMNGAAGLAYDNANNRLFVSQGTAHRVTVYSVASIANGQNATNVLGQPNYTTATAAITQNGLNSPQGIAYDSTTSRLFVTQSTANRITIYNTLTSNLNGQNASNVLGQPNYTSSTAATTQNGMNVPQGISYAVLPIGNRLFVGQSGANRVTDYNVTSITDGQNAANVLGQSNYTTATAATTQNGMNVPQGVALDTAGRLFVAQSGANRITIYGLASITNGQNASNILGQPNYTTATLSTAQNGLSSPFGVSFDGTNGRLFVADASNNRVLAQDVKTLADGQNAVDLLGQYDETNFVNPVPVYTKATANDGPNKFGFSGPSFVAYDSTNLRLFVSEFTNNRVLVYAMNADGSFPDRIPDNVLGQSNYYTSALGNTQNGLNAPGGLVYDSVNNRLFVAQSTGNRVTVYNVSSITDGQNATNVLGQVNFTTVTAATTQPGMNAPYGVAYDSANSRLFVAQANGNRVTVYAVSSITNGQNATNVLGQPNYTTNAVANTQNGLNGGVGLAYDSANTRLFVVNNSGNRVTVYNVSSITDGQNATNVLGQPNYGGNAAATTQNGMNVPSGLAYDAVNGRLFVSQQTGNRVTVYNVSSITDGQNATNVLGQPNFTTPTAATTQNGASAPQGIAYDSVNSRLFVAQNGANRVTVYSVASMTNGQNAADLLGQYDQSSFTTPIPSYIKSGANDGPNKFGFNSPAFIALDNTNHRLFVSDQTNNRVLVYALNADGTFPDRLPDNVLGQSNYYSNAAATTQNGMNVPSGLVYDNINNRLFIAQSSNNSVTVYSTTTITNGQNATNILGQPNYASGSPATTQNGMNTPKGLAYDSTNSRLYVSQTANHRITIYNVSSITDGQNAVDLLGQYDETNFVNPVPVYTKLGVNGGPNKFGMNGPVYLTLDATNHRLFVDDSGNNRVLVYALNTDNTFQDRLPDNVLGQSNYYSSSAANTQNGMNTPQGLAYDSVNNRLFVSSNSNNRVTVYDVSSITDGENAANVLGQPNFTTTTAATTQNGMNLPYGMEYDSANTRLFVAQYGANRVVVYNVASITNGQNGTNVLGQPNYTTATAANTQNGMNNPLGFAYDSANGRLFVAQDTGNRVTVYDVSSITDGENATNVLGQPNYTTITLAVTQNGLSGPRGLAYDSANNRLFVSQLTGNRVTVFNVSSITGGQNATNVLGQSSYVLNTATNTQAAMNGPIGIAYDSTNARLFVGQFTNNSVRVYNISSFTDGQNAADLVGQFDETNFVNPVPVYTKQGNNDGPNKFGFNGPAFLEFDNVNHRLFVNDQTNNRILVYAVNSDGTLTDHMADNVLGQPNYYIVAASNAQNGVSLPNAMVYDSTNNRLFNAQQNSHRVVVFPTASIVDGENASNILGQSSYATSALANTQNGMNFPSGLAYDSVNNRLFISQTGNNRITVYKMGMTDGQNATSVLGEQDFTTVTATSTQNGLSAPKGVLYDSTSSSLFATDNGNNRLVIYGISSLTNGQNASDMAGQYDETNFINPVPAYTKSIANNGPNKFGLSAASYMAIDGTNHRLFVSDTTNNRVLVYGLNSDNTFSDRVPDNVLGQSNYYSNAAVITQNGMSQPKGILYYAAGNLLIVSQAGANRVVDYDVSSITDGENALNVIGQANFTTGTSGNTQATLNNPIGMDLDLVTSPARLFVADNLNNRVLAYNVAAITNGMNAVNVLGQSTFASNAANTTINGMSAPINVAYDSAKKRLFVADSGNNRVTVFTVPTIANGQNATNILGQPNYTSASAATTQNGMSSPQGLVYDGSKKILFVAENGNNRVTAFRVFSINDGMNATSVLGQSNFTTAATAVTQNGLNGPVALAWEPVNSRLFVSDSMNNRLLVFDASNAAIAGKVFSDEGVTPLAGAKVAVSVNGNAVTATGTTDAGGQYTIVNMTVTGGSILTLYTSGNVSKSVTVTLSSGATMTGMNLYANNLIVRSDSGSAAVTNAQLKTGQNTKYADISAIYNVDAANALQVAAGKQLYVLGGKTFTPSAAVKATNVKVLGTMTLGANALTVTGSLIANAGTMTTSTGITLGALATNATLNLGSNTVQNVTIGNPAPIAYWKLDDGTGSSIAKDSSGNGYDGTLVNGPTWSTNVPSFMKFFDPKSLNFNGTNQYVMVPDTAALRFTNVQSFTISTQIKLSKVPTAWSAIISKSRDLGSQYGIWISDTSKWVFGGGAGNVTSALSATANVWHLATAVQDGSTNTRTLYVDGVNVGTGPAQTNNGTGNLWIGGAASVSEYIPGTLDDVRIYNRALSASEVASLYNGNLTTSSGSYTLGSALTVNGSLNIQSGILDASSSNYNVNIAGSYQNRGAFVTRSNTVTFNGTGKQTISGSTVFNNVTVNNGLVGYWNFDTGTGVGIVKDSSGNGNDGQRVGSGTTVFSSNVPTTKFYNLRSMSFNGSSDKVVMPLSNSLNPPAGLTVSAWVNAPSYGPSSWPYTILTKGSVAAGVNSMEYNLLYGWFVDFNFNITDGSTLYRAISFTTPQPNTWYHVVGRFVPGQSVDLFVNNVKTSTSLPGTVTTIQPLALPLGFGDDITRGNYFTWLGNIDDVRIYNRALSDSEVAALYNGNANTGSGIYKLGSDLTVTGSLSIVSGGLDVSASNYGVTLAGNYQNFGSFNARNGTVTLNGATQTLTGSTVFYNLSKTRAAATTLFFDYTGRQSASGSLTLRGAASNLLSIRSTKNASAASILLDGDSGTQTIDHLDVKDSNATGGQSLFCLIASQGCVNSGNDTNWIFSQQKSFFEFLGF